MATIKPAIQKIKQVTLPVHKLRKGVEYYFKITGPMHVGKKIDDKKEPATIFEAIDCETGELGIVVTTTILRKELNENYPGDSYVGKFFSVSVNPIPGKDYNGVSLAEIADPTEALAEAAAERKRRAEAKAASEAAGDGEAPASPNGSAAAAAPAEAPAAPAKGGKGGK